MSSAYVNRFEWVRILTPRFRQSLSNLRVIRLLVEHDVEAALPSTFTYGLLRSLTRELLLM